MRRSSASGTKPCGGAWSKRPTSTPSPITRTPIASSGCSGRWDSAHPMCGLAGIFEYDASARPQRGVLQRMTGLLAHRGPDDFGYLEHGSVALGHRRLSIIDLSPGGHQPMANDDGSLWIIYN